MKRSASHKQQRLHHYRGVSVLVVTEDIYRRMKNHSTDDGFDDDVIQCNLSFVLLAHIF